MKKIRKTTKIPETKNNITKDTSSGKNTDNFESIKWLTGC